MHFAFGSKLIVEGVHSIVLSWGTVGYVHQKIARPVRIGNDSYVFIVQLFKDRFHEIVTNATQR